MFNPVLQEGTRILVDSKRRQEAVTKGAAILDAIASKKSGPLATVAGVAATEWIEPDHLSEQVDALPYPVDALPLLLRDAIVEVQSFVQAPYALVASSALSTLSVAAQGLADVRRDSQLCGPVSIYLLVVADSGERKTKCDRFFGGVIRSWEDKQRKATAQQVLEAAAEHAAFEARKAGISEAIKRRSRLGKDTEADALALRELMKNPPAGVNVPRLLFEDATPEQLAFLLATGWPSGGILSAEAGTVFGAHGMSSDAVLRNLSLLNVLWDGGEMTVDRRTKESFRLRGRRLSFGLMVQASAFQDFLDRAGTLPRGTGFLSRFLMTWPLSTQGDRPYKQAPEFLPALERFSGRIRDLLDTELSTDPLGSLTPTVLDLTKNAHAVWARFHDDVERELGRSGKFRDVRDVAAKAAENAARTAALFHLLEKGPSGKIEEEQITQAALIVAWHLIETVRVFGELEAPRPLLAAIKLDQWLRDEAAALGSSRISLRRVRQYGPACIRQDKDLRAAMLELNERGRARFEIEGTKRYVALNPALMEIES